MDSKSNVISLESRLKSRSRTLKTKQAKKAAPVLDMTERRNEILVEERRQVRRTILTEFIGACVIVPSRGLCKVAIHDISENGIAFDIEPKGGRFAVGEQVAVRVYLNQQTYFPFVVTIQNTRLEEDEGVWRHGASFVKGTMNDRALQHFVKFIETVSAGLERDTGDVMVSNINR